MVEEQGQTEQSTVSGDQASGEEQGHIEQSTVTGDPALGEEQGQIEQSTVTGDPASGEEQGQIERSTVTADPVSGEQGQTESAVPGSSASGEGQMAQASTGTGDDLLKLEPVFYSFLSNQKFWLQ